MKRVDDLQRAWLESALARARGKTTMAVVGHPFYAGGGDMTADNEDFARLKRLLLDGGATIMMAGDTHDLEYYAEPRSAGARDVHYFVNGGGGAYMSFGTALDWPSDPATSVWAFYPDHDAVSRKIQARTPAWKRPARACVRRRRETTAKSDRRPSAHARAPSGGPIRIAGCAAAAP